MSDITARNVVALFAVLVCLAGIAGSMLLVIFHVEGPELWPMPMAAVAIVFGTAAVWIVLTGIEKLMERLGEAGSE